MEVFENEKADSLEIVGFLYRKGKVILTAVLISIFIAGVVTFFLPKRYVSYGIVFPVSNNNIESVIETPMFGYDVEADRMIQLLESDELRDSVTQKFDLLNYYKINRSDLDWHDQLKEEFVKDVSFIRTPYMSVVISAETQKPELSAELVNYIIDYTDGIRSRIFKRNQQIAFKSIEKEYYEQKNLVDTLKAKMGKLRNSSQSDLIAILNPQGLVQTSGTVAKSPDNTEFERTLNQYLFEQSQLNAIAEKYQKAQSSNDRPITKSYVVNRAQPSYKKVAPSFMLNLSITGLATFIFTIIILLISDKLTKFRSELPKQ